MLVYSIAGAERGLKMEDYKICSCCGKKLPLDAFGFRDKRKNDTRRPECKACHNEIVKKGYRKRKEAAEEKKKECIKCGEKRKYLLDFHHLDPTIKDESVAALVSNNASIKKIEEEIKKCVVLCSNCHREFHYFERNEGLKIADYLRK